jgi:cbb3-type cytochrome oxidase subunit 1
MSMTGLAARFFGSAVVYAVLGMALGLVMGITKDHSQMPTHAHLLVIGWVSFAIFGFFYHLFPQAATSRLAVAHFWLAQASFVVLIAGLFLLFSGHAGADPIAAVASIGYLASMILFGVVALPVVTNHA